MNETMNTMLTIIGSILLMIGFTDVFNDWINEAKLDNIEGKRGTYYEYK